MHVFYVQSTFNVKQSVTRETQKVVVSVHRYLFLCLNAAFS